MRIATLIIGLLLGLLLFLQSSLVAGLSDLANQDEHQQAGAVGVFMSWVWLVAAALVIAFPLVSCILFALSSLALFGASGDFPDLAIYGVIAIVLAIFSFLGWRGKLREQNERQMERLRQDERATRLEMMMQSASATPLGIAARSQPMNNASYAAVTPRPVTSSAQVSRPDTVTCSACGTSTTPDRKFCGECGARLSLPVAIKCGQCGTENSAKTKFCAECGTRLGQAEAALSPRPASAKIDLVPIKPGRVRTVWAFAMVGEDGSQLLQSAPFESAAKQPARGPVEMGPLVALEAEARNQGWVVVDRPAGSRNDWWMLRFGPKTSSGLFQGR